MTSSLPTSASKLDWPVVKPFVVRKIAAADDIDGFGHVNNRRYIDWALETAWAHSTALGFPFEEFKRLGAGFVVWRHEFDYAAPALEGDEIAIATWIADNDGRLRLTRAYEMRRIADGKALFRGRTRFITIDMETGKPRRMPKAYAEVYRAAQSASEPNG
ncbi:MAG: acyl-CoA thioesterase [Parvularculaceae bacterium]